MKVLVVDDHPDSRLVLQSTLMQADAKLQILEALTVREALNVSIGNPDLNIVLVDSHHTPAVGLDAVRSFGQRRPPVPVVLMSDSEDPSDITLAIESGAVGFIPRSQTREITINALRLVLAGGIYLPPQVVRRLPSITLPRPPASAVGPDYRELGLTERQAQVLALLVEGMPNKLICRRLDLAEGTVKIHVTAILKALKVTNRTQAVIEANRLGVRLPALVNREPPNAP